MWLLAGSIGEIVAYPPAVLPEQNEWYERDGVEVKGVPLEQEDKLVSIGFVAGEPLTDFIKGIREQGAYKGHLRGVPWEVELRPKEVTWQEQGYRWGSVKMYDLSDKFPREPMTPIDVGMHVEEGNAIGGRPLSSYGVKLLGIDKRAEVVREYPRGAKRLTREAYQMGVGLFMQAPTIDAFIHNRNALLYELTKSDDNRLTLRGTRYSCYYVSCMTDWYVAEEERVMWKFDLIMMVTR